MIFKNYTPHLLNVLTKEGKVIAMPSEGTARVATEETTSTIDEFLLTSSTFGEVVGLPEPKSNVIYVVSRLVLNALNGTRNDVVAPGPLLRDNKGNVTACNGFGL